MSLGTTTLNRSARFLLAVIAMLMLEPAAAQTGPRLLNISGGLFNPNGSPVLNNNVTFRIEIRDKAGLCVLYSETHSGQDLSSTKGGFSLLLGGGSSPANKLSGTTALDANVFKNPGVVAAFTDCPSGLTLNAGDERVVRVYYDIGSGLTAMNPDVPVVAAAYSMVAETLQGKTPEDFINVQGTAASNLQQTNLEYAFSLTNWQRLKDLIDGVSSSYLPTAGTGAFDFGNRVLTGVAAPGTTADAVNKGYADSYIGGKATDLTSVGAGFGNGQTLVWDQVQNKWVTGAATDSTKLPLAGGTMVGNINMGGYDLLNVGNIVQGLQKSHTLGRFTSLEEATLVGTLGTGSIGMSWYNTDLKTYKIWDGSNAITQAYLSSVGTSPGTLNPAWFPASGVSAGTYGGATSVPVFTVGADGRLTVAYGTTIAGVAPGGAAGGDLTGSYPSPLIAPLAVTTAKLGDNAITAAKIKSTGVAINRLIATDPVTPNTLTYFECPINDQIMTWTASGWACTTVAALSPVKTVAGRTPDAAGNVALSAFDINGVESAATKDYGTAAGELVELDGAGKIPSSLLPVGTGTITSVNVVSPLTGGGVSGAVTVGIDVGTGANQVVRLNASAQIPAVDGSLLLDVNASKIGTRAVTSAAPGVAQVLAWNGSQWEPTSAAVGSVTGVVSGAGLVAGTVTSYGTIAVDVGTIANKVVQFDGSARYPANDGSLITNVNAVRLQSNLVSATAPTTNQLLKWNGSQWEPTTDMGTGTITTVVSGTGLVAGTIVSSGTIAVDVGTGANQVVQLNGSAQIPAVDGSLLTGVNASKIGTRAVTSTAPGVAQVLAWNGSQWEPTSAAVGSVVNVTSGTGLVAGSITSSGTINIDVGSTSNKIVQLDGSGLFPAIDSSNLFNVNASKIGTRAVTSAAPGVAQVLAWNGSQWEPTTAAVGSVTSVTSGAGLVPGTITGVGTVAVDVGTGANKVVQFDGSARYPANDGSLIANVNAVRLQSQLVSATAPTANQILKWNGSHWEPSTDTGTGTITSVVSGTGLVAGTITVGGTIAVDVGTGANQVVQLNGSSQIPAVDGSLLTGVNASKIGTRAVTSAAPGVAQVLAWNGSQWEPTSAAVGSVTGVVSGTGLVAGTVTSYGSINVDVGTTANKIVQLDGSARYPANDGSLITNVNAVRLQSQLVSATAPTANQILKWNGSHWEPSTDTGTGTVTSVVSGTGLVAGTITNGGTIAVDVGTGANQVVQLNGSSQIPAVDGSLLTGVNASKIGTRAVTSAAPGVSQVLGWNGSQWEPMSAAVGSMTSVTAGAGMVPGTITSAGTVAVDVGTAANKVVQFDGSARYPANDGSLITNVNAVRLQSQLVSATAPTTNQILKWNGSQWEPSTDSGTGTVTSVVSGTGLVAGTITSGGTIAVDVGTGANQVVQLNGSSQIPAVDGSLLTGVNASTIGTRAIATTLPTTNQILTWNGSRWEPMAASSSLSWPLAATPGTASAAAPSYSFASDTDTGFYSPGVGTASLATNGTARLTVDSVGNVGVGSTTPAQKLDVNGTTQSTRFFAGNGTNAAPAYSFTSDNDTGFVYNSGAGTLDVTVDGTPQFSFNGGGVTGNGGNGSPVISRDESGGVTSPAYSFKGSLGTGMSAPATNTLAFSSAGSERMRVDSAGNVGIGTTSPGSVALDVVGTGANNSALLVPRLTTALRPAGANGMIRYNTNTNKFEFFENNAWVNYGTGSGAAGATFPLLASPGTTPSTAPSYSFASDSDTGFYSPGVGTASLATNGTARMTIDSRGYVGVGTTSPTSLFSIGNGSPFTVDNSGNVGSAYLYAGNLSGGSTITLTLENTHTNVAVGQGAFMEFKAASLPLAQIHGIFDDVSGTNKGALVFNTQSSSGMGEQMRITNAGKVGIGTATPGSVALDVVGTGANNSALLVPRLTTALRPAGANGMIRYNTNTNKFEFFENNAWVNYGTGSGAAGATFPLLASPGTTPSSAPSYSFASDSDTGFFSPGVGTASLATNGTARMTINSSGYVGIGTASPTQMFEVNGTAKANVVHVGDGSNSAPALTFSSATNTGLFYSGGSGLNISDAGNATFSFYSSGFYGGGANGSIYLGSDAGNAAGPNYSFKGPAGWSDMGMYAPASGNLAFSTSGTERIRVSAAGNVGIGTSSPGSVALEVVGTGANNSAILVPRLTTALRPAGANGMIRYNTNTNKFEFFENNAWVNYGTGSGAAGATFPLLASPGTTPSSAPSYSFASDSDTGFYSPGVGTASLATNGTARLTVDSAGNFGIGTTTPGDVLHVQRNQAAGTGVSVINTTTTSGAQSSIFLQAGADKTIKIGVMGPNTAYSSIASGEAYLEGGATGLAFWQNSAAPIRFVTDSTETLRLTGGKVGIGTTSPGSVALDVVGTGANNSALLVPRLTTALRPAGANGMIRYNTNTNKFEFFENNAWVNYGTGSSGSTSFPLLASPGTTPSTAPSYSFASDSDTGFFSPGVGTASLATNGTARFTIDSAGNIGVGTAAPGSLLHLSTTVTGDNSPFMSFAPSLGNGNTIYNLVGRSAANNDAGFIGYTHNTTQASRSLGLGHYGQTPVLNIMNDNTVGIATTDPGTALDVYDAGGAQAQIRTTNNSWTRTSGIDFFSTSAAPAGFVGYRGTGSSAPAVQGVWLGSWSNGIPVILGSTTSDGDSTERLRITPAGNIGIGTTSPGSVALEVVGTGANNSAILVPRLTTALRPAGANGMIRYNTNTNKFEFFENNAWVNYGTGSSGSASFPLLASPGTTPSTAPSYAFASDSDTGFYSPGVGTAALATNGTARLTVDSSGNVGVGTTAPFYKLTVSGNAAASNLYTEAMVYFNANDTGLSWPGNNAAITTVSSTSLKFETAGSERLRITNTGNIGIGTTSPGSVALEIVGTGANNSALLVPRLTTALRPAGANGMLRYNTNTNKFEFFENGSWVNYGTGASGSVSFPLLASPGTTPASAPSYSFTSDSDTGFYSTGIGTASFATNGTARMTLDSSGNVGIGTAIPAGVLEVYKPAGNSDVLVLHGSSATTQSIAANVSNWPTASQINARIKFIDDSNYSAHIAFETNRAATNSTTTTELMRLTASGTLGIGTSSPGSVALDVVGTGANNSALLVPRLTTALRPAGANGMIRYNTNTNKFEFFENNAWVNYGTGASGSVSFPLLASPGTTPETAPSYAFASDSDTGFFSPGVGTAAFATNGTTRLTIGSTGYVGIGLTNPTYPLAINSTLAVDHALINLTTPSLGSGNTAYMYLGRSASNYDSGYIGYTHNSTQSLRRLGIGIQGQTTPPVTIMESGAVGIGTTSPGSVAFEVVGTGANNSAILVPRLTTALRPAGANGMLRYNTNTNKFEFFENGSWVNYGTGSGGSVSFPLLASPGTTPASAPSYAFASDSDTGFYSTGVGTASFATNGTARMTIDSTGQVGIGTAAPDDKLKINSNISGLTGMSIYAGHASGAAAIQLYGADASGTFAAYPSTYGNATLNDRVALITNGDASGIVISAPFASQDIRFSQNNTERMRIDSTGNIGIGTTSVGSAALDVAGTGANNSALLVPRLTTALRPAGANGMIRYNTNTNKFEFFENSAWVNYGTSGGSVSFPLLASPGTTPPTAPSYAFASDSDTGFFSPGVGTSAFATNGTTRMTINSLGQVGIGTTSPASLFHVAGSNTTTSGSVKIMDFEASVNPASASTGTTRTMSMYSAYEATGVNSPSASIQAGIFTADLTVNNTLGFATGVVAQASNNGSSTLSSGIGILAQVTNGAGTITTAKAGDFSVSNSGTLTNAYGVYVGSIAGTNKWSVYASDAAARSHFAGTVGIGTTTPGSAALDVVGTGANNSAILIPRNTTALRPAGANGMIRYNTNTNKFEFFENGSWATHVGSGDFKADGTVPMTGTMRLNNNYISNDGGSEGIRVSDAGDVTFGSPTANSFTRPPVLNMARALQPYLMFEHVGSDTMMIGMDSTNFGGIATESTMDGIKFKVNGAWGTTQYIDNATAAMTILNNGNVGVGTTNPVHPMHVLSSTATADTVTIENSHASGAAELSVKGTGGTWKASFGYGNGSFSSPWASKAFIGVESGTDFLVSHGTTVTTMFKSSGNVGVGLSSPVKRVDIMGASGQPGSLGIRSLSGEGAKIYFGTNNQYDGTGSNSAGVLSFNDNISGGFEFRTNNGSGDPDNVSKNKVVILAAGQVGIGTTTPGSTLTVNGSFAVSPSSVNLTADNTLLTTVGVSYLSLTSNNATATNRTICLAAGTVGQRLIIANATNNDFELIESLAGSQTCGAGSQTIDTNSGTITWGSADDLHEFVFTVNSVWKQLN